MKQKTVIIIAVAVFVLFLVMVGIGFFVMWEKIGRLAPPEEIQEEEVVEGDVGRSEMGPIYPLETFIVNLADAGEPRYLKITVNLELEESDAEEEVDRRLPQIRDLFLSLLPTKKSEQLQNMEGKQAVKDELVENLNAILQTGQVSQIYFTDFVIQ